MSDVIDEAELMLRVDGDIEFLAETIEMLEEDSPALLEQIHAAVAAKDAVSLTHAAHALKGMVSNFCAGPAEAAAKALEVMGREDRLSDVDAAVALVKQETGRLLEALASFLQSKM